MKSGNIAALDPGRDKCGVAVLDGKGEILFRQVVDTGSVVDVLKEKQQSLGFSVLVTGDGTTSKTAQQRMKDAFPKLEIVVVDEYNTTQLAKKEYWKLNPPTGWRKLMPLGLQTPSEPVDDIVAVILGRRYLGEKL